MKQAIGSEGQFAGVSLVLGMLIPVRRDRLRMPMVIGVVLLVQKQGR